MCMPTLSIFFGPVTNIISHCTQIFLQIFNPHKAPNGILNDYCDGSNFAQHEVFSKDPHALQVQLYYDDIDICNPIGSKSVIHKLGKFTISTAMIYLHSSVGLFYYTLCNIHPALRVKVWTIMLVAIVETKHINKYGISEILEPFIESMQQLESVSYYFKNRHDTTH